MKMIFSLFAVATLLTSVSGVDCDPPIPYCTNCDGSSYCVSCSVGFPMPSTADSCVPCLQASDVPHCTTCTNHICAECSAGYFVKAGSNGASCVVCNSAADITNCTTCSSDGVCSACGTGYYPNTAGTACISCSTAITNCTECSSTSSTQTCTKCGTGFTLTSGACVFSSKIAFTLLSLVAAFLL